MTERWDRDWADQYEFLMRRIYRLESRNYDYGADSSLFHNNDKELNKESGDKLRTHMKKAVNYLLAKDGFSETLKDILLDTLNDLEGYKTKEDFYLFVIKVRSIM